MYKKTITIGAKGYLGSHLAQMLHAYGIENYEVGSSATSQENDQVITPFDVTKRTSFDALPHDADVIFFFAGLTGTEAGFTNYEKFVQTNEIGLLHLLDWMRSSHSRARLVFPSSRLVYKGKTNTFLAEDSDKAANTIYALNKLAGEAALEMYHRAFGLDYTVFRICVPYGNLNHDHYSFGTIGFMLEKAAKGMSIPVFGKGEVRRTLTHVQDICHNIIMGAGIPQTKNSIFNIGGEPFSLAEVATLLADRFGVDIAYLPWPKLANDIESGDTLFDDTKLKEAGLGQYQHTLAKWIQTVKM